MTPENQLLQKVEEIYNNIHQELSENTNESESCNACGKCCNFEKYDHRLFLTTPEMIYLKEKLKPQKLKKMTTGICPYNSDGKCQIYNLRFAGCRIFCCNSNENLQAELSESAIRSFKKICPQFQIPYLYTDLKTALNQNIPQT